MDNSVEFRVAVFPGDGIGAEITEPTMRLLDRVAGRTGGFSFAWQHCDAGAAYYLDHGTALPKNSLQTARQADAILLVFGKVITQTGNRAVHVGAPRLSSSASSPVAIFTSGGPPRKSRGRGS